MPASITLTVSHLATSTSFFLSALQPLNYVFRGQQDQTVGFGPKCPPNVPADFWITQEIPGVPAGAAHVAFPAASHTQVQEFFFAALKAGGKIHGEPAQRDASGYYSAAVIDFDGNSIEAVYRPGVGHHNQANEDVKSTVSRQSAAPSVHAPSTVAKPKTVVAARSPTVVSQARSSAPSQARTFVAPSHVSTQQTLPAAKQEPKPRPQGDVLDTLVSEVRNAASVARDLVNNVRPNLISSNSSPAANNTGSTGGLGASDAIVGTLLGVAAGAALHYAFSNRSKENAVPDDPKPEPRRPSIAGRSMTDPNLMGPEYAVSGGTSASYYETTKIQRAIEPAPSAYSYNAKTHYEGPRLITMYDNDPARSEYASTVKAPIQPTTSMSRRRSIDSGFGPGPQDLELAASAVSTKPSRQSKKGTKMLDAPPTSYRAPTVLTTVETQMSKTKARSGSKSRSTSISRITTLSNRKGRDDEKHSEATPSRSRSQSRHTDHSRRSRRDTFDAEEMQTVVHVTESLHRSKTYQKASEHDRSSSRRPSTVRASSKHSHHRHDQATDPERHPHDYPLPPSRAATWAGSEQGSFVSARSGRNGGTATIPKTIIGKLTPQNLKQGGHTTSYHDFALKNGAAESIIGKHRDVARLDVTDREVRPEDSVSQISVDTRASRRSKASARR